MRINPISFMARNVILDDSVDGEDRKLFERLTPELKKIGGDDFDFTISYDRNTSVTFDDIVYKVRAKLTKDIKCINPLWQIMQNWKAENDGKEFFKEKSIEKYQHWDLEGIGHNIFLDLPTINDEDVLTPARLEAERLQRNVKSAKRELEEVDG